MPILLGLDIGGSAVKSAVSRDGNIIATGRSEPYEKPDTRDIIAAIRQACRTLSMPPSNVGVCLPGIVDDAGVIRASVNLPSLVGESIREVVAAALESSAVPIRVISDARATAHDLYTSLQITGRLFVLALGTGIGAAVLDDGAVPLHVDGDSPGHFGQLDVSLEDSPPVGPDGGAGSLEAYLGVPALRTRYGDAFLAALLAAPIDAPPLRALVRSIRIAHALFRPHHVILAGGIGIRLGPVVASVHAAVNQQLTSIARPDWTLDTGSSDHHAARGAAQLSAITSK